MANVNGLKPEVWGRVGPDPRAELQVAILHLKRDFLKSLMFPIATVRPTR